MIGQLPVYIYIYINDSVSKTEASDWCKRNTILSGSHKHLCFSWWQRYFQRQKNEKLPETRKLTGYSIVLNYRFSKVSMSRQAVIATTKRKKPVKLASSYL